MKDFENECADELLKILEKAGKKGIQLGLVKKDLRKHLRNLAKKEQDLAIEASIKHVLDEWRAIKIVDEDASSELTWYLKYLTEEESKRFRELSEVDQMLLRILFDFEGGFQPGAMKKDEAIKKLRELGFSLEDINVIPGIVSKTRVPDDDGMQMWVYIIPQYEFSEEYKALQEESLEKSRKREERMMRESD
ncbi:MAG: hypothetical protein AM325_013120 [Candidatus Thorarchaeota archaeon SMTZ1-45]|nr:MAG: hypothetical protein AM325_14780 [Candidatus Thorarchaeota archaeon SMTZ1-45]